ncbi:guanylate kinase [bacterium]|nr:guanylate kinase [bacterium]
MLPEKEYSYEAGFLVVLTAPSGAGKTTIREGVLKSHPEIMYSISATTRPKRDDESDGQDYFFVSQDKFVEMIENDEMIEWAKVHDHYYGTPKNFIKENIRKGLIIIMDIDVQGGVNIKKRFPDAVFIFVLPPSFEELGQRLIERGTDTMETIKLRVENARKEIGLMYNYNYIIVNDDINLAILETESIIIAEKCRVSRNVDFYKEYLK